MHNINVRGATGLDGIRGLTRPRICFRRKADTFEFVVARRKHTLGFSTLPFAFRCHAIVEAIQSFQIWGTGCFLFTWTMQRCRICQFSGTVLCAPPVLIGSFSSEHSWKFFRSFVDDNLMSLQMIMVETGSDWRSEIGSTKPNYRNVQNWYTIPWSKTPTSSSSAMP